MQTLMIFWSSWRLEMVVSECQHEWQEKSLLPPPASLELSSDPCWTSCPCIVQWGRFGVTGLGLVVSHPWGCLFLGAQELRSLAWKLNLATTYSGRRRSFSRRCYKRTCEVITIAASILLKLFSQNTSIIILLMGITSLYFVTASGRSSCSRLLRKPRNVRADPSRFVKLCKKYSSCNVE